MANPQYIKSLFYKFLEDSCTPDEIETIIYYLKNSDDAAGFPRIEEVRARLGELPRMNADRADEIFGRIVSSEALFAPSIAGKPKPDYRWRYWSIAATFLGFVLLSGMFYWFYASSDSLQYATTFGETRKISLPDGTEVMLNANSELRLSESWQEQDIREVWLEGEAFFSVVHTQDNRRFLVHTADNFTVEVLGTQFNVNSRDEKATVVLNSGKVKVKTQGQEGKAQWVMQPGDLVEYERESRQINQKTVDTTLYTSWKDNLLLFKDTPLEKIAGLIKDNYGYEVGFENDSLAHLYFTGSNPADQPELLLKTLARSFDLNIKRENGRITLEEKQKNAP
ncbi:transmembrane sensor [Catalinimonas alkaloidigena]|uniref:FecR family protein n=1 Tax=Catalinimonas alkaloidigena TaxID=1075417 RepID=UPI0024068EDE|nr:FecR domain-containing protein [Catalinimonas alkaloidigena]MDF9796567.1 transmembrane sensor [Catalinimonas alkaloidigena]